jgi:isopentenyldiphosphate isomerase/phosphoglycolate phosphatase-like HAD superfamily hydrolase
MIKVYAFDFDGVISNSAKGWAFFANDAWVKMGNKPLSLDKIEKYRPYIKDAADSFAIMILLSKNSRINREKIKKIIEKYPEEATAFRKLFFICKEDMIQQNKDKLADLYGPYDFMVPFMQKMKDVIVYIVTNNEKTSILPTIKKYRIPIKESNILDSKIAHNKKDLILKICQIEKIDPENILFIEDSIAHAKDVTGTGVNIALASWGFVLPEDISEAKKLGMKILTRDNIESILTTDDMDEYFDVVDENDKAVGKEKRGIVHSKGLWHRGVCIIVANTKGEILLQKRSMTKDLYKGYWAEGSSGHVNSGDTYEETARRELKEEIGVSAKLEYLFNFKKYTGNDNEFIRVFFCRHDGPFKVNKDEVDFVKFFTMDEIRKMLKTDRFTPGTLGVFEELKKRPELLKRLLS